MKKLIFTAALALTLINCTSEQDTDRKEVNKKSTELDSPELGGGTIAIPIEHPKDPALITYIKITLKCKKYTGETQYDFVGYGFSDEGICYYVKSEWKMVVDLDTGKPRHKQVITAHIMTPGTGGFPC